MYFDGILIGASAFVIIGLFHPLVIKGEYYFGKRIWPVFAVGGLLCLTAALLLDGYLERTLFGITGFSLLWSIHEIIEQEQRVKKGWFPKNPKRNRE